MYYNYEIFMKQKLKKDTIYASNGNLRTYTEDVLVYDSIFKNFINNGAISVNSSIDVVIESSYFEAIHSEKYGAIIIQNAQNCILTKACFEACKSDSSADVLYSDSISHATHILLSSYTNCGTEKSYDIFGLYNTYHADASLLNCSMNKVKKTAGLSLNYCDHSSSISQSIFANNTVEGCLVYFQNERNSIINEINRCVFLRNTQTNPNNDIYGLVNTGKASFIISSSSFTSNTGWTFKLTSNTDCLAIGCYFDSFTTNIEGGIVTKSNNEVICDFSIIPVNRCRDIERKSVKYIYKKGIVYIALLNFFLLEGCKGTCQL